MNPVYWLDLRIRVREKRLWIIASFFICTLLVISAVVLASTVLEDYNRHIKPSDVGTGIIWAVLFCQVGLLIMLAPLASAGRISQEREQRTMPALINSSISALRVALGKLWGAWTFVIWLGMLVIPFLFVASLWGGPRLGLILICVAINIYAGFILSAVALGFSGLFGRSLTAYLVTGSFLFAWMVVIPLLGVLAMTLADGGDTYQTLIAYLAWFHNPIYPLIRLVSNEWVNDMGQTIWEIAYALAVWTAIGAGGLFLAVRGLKREVY